MEIDLGPFRAFLFNTRLSRGGYLTGGLIVGVEPDTTQLNAPTQAMSRSARFWVILEGEPEQPPGALEPQTELPGLALLLKGGENA